MSRRVAAPVLAVALSLLAAATSGVAPARAADPAALRARLTRDSTAIAGMLDRGAVDSAFAAAQTTVAALRGSGDPAFDARLTLFVPGLQIRLARANDALPGVLDGGRAAAAARDTSVWMLAMRMEAMCRNYRGETAQAEKLCARWDALARASGSIEYQAFAATMRGWFAWRRGDFVTARRELESALPMFERTTQHVGLMYTLNVLGGVLMGQGDYVAARTVFGRLLTLAATYGNVRARDYALDNLGRIESRIGDPDRALALWRQTLASHASRKENADWMVAADNIVDLALALGHVDEALALAREAVTLAERESLGMEVPWQRAYLGEALWASGRREAAKRLWRDLLRDRTPDQVEPATVAADGLITGLADQDSTAAALAIAEDVARDLVPAAEQESRGRLVSTHARLLTDSGRAREALALAKPVAIELEKTGDLEVALAAWTEVVRASRRSARPDSTARAIVHATAVWERGRAHANELEFRELRGEQAARLKTEAVAFALAHPPAGTSPEASAFAVAQRFKTRTLLERVAGPTLVSDPAPRGLEPALVDLERFQHDVLAPGERLLEFVTGADTTRVFDVTRDRCVVIALPGERALAPMLELALEAGIAERVDAGAAPALAARRLGQTLLAPLGRLAGTRLIIAADGPLQRIPFAMLAAPADGGAPLGAIATLSMVPSASLLAALRERSARPDGRLFALAGAPAPGRAPLPGARREVETLAARYRDVETWFGDARARAPLTPERLAGRRALHFAGHAHIDDQLPWRSGLLIGADSRGEDSLLTASRIAANPGIATLVVLSSCESGGGRAREGEGVSGLASAFLAAGGQAVVASLWPVEDRATEALMSRFYDGLAHGLAADHALAEAQRVLRDDPATAAPSRWAGFVLVGDGRTTLPLTRRWLPLTPEGFGVLAIALLALVAAILGWSRTRARAG